LIALSPKFHSDVQCCPASDGRTYIITSVDVYRVRTWSGFVDADAGGVPQPHLEDILPSEVSV
jgi:hypothetical protein